MKIIYISVLAIVLLQSVSCGSTFLEGDIDNDSNISDSIEYLEDGRQFIYVECPTIDNIIVPSVIDLAAGVYNGIPPIDKAWIPMEMPEDVPYEDRSLYSGNESVLTIPIVIEGIYILRFIATDSEGYNAFCDSQISATNTNGLTIELTWNPPDNSCASIGDLPECDITDTDLHLANLAFAEDWFHDWDCYYANCIFNSEDRLDWYGEDQKLLRDDRIGYGPEIISVTRPSEEHDYIVGVHMYDNVYSSYPPFGVDANISIKCNGIAAFTSRTHTFEEVNNFWVVAKIEWNEGICNIETIVDSDGSDVEITEIDARNRLW